MRCYLLFLGFLLLFLFSLLLRSWTALFFGPIQARIPRLQLGLIGSFSMIDSGTALRQGACAQLHPSEEEWQLSNMAQRNQMHTFGALFSETALDAYGGSTTSACDVFTRRTTPAPAPVPSCSSHSGFGSKATEQTAV